MSQVTGLRERQASAQNIRCAAQMRLDHLVINDLLIARRWKKEADNISLWGGRAQFSNISHFLETLLRIAIVHDWLYVVGGAEKVLAGIFRCFPESDLFCLFDLLSSEDRTRIGYEHSKTSFLQKMPGIKKHHRLYLPVMPLAIEQFDLSEYDVVISSSYAVAKGVLTGPDQLHVSYVHSPMRYAWDLQHQYLRESKLERGPKSWLARILLHRMRLWDLRSSYGVDAYLANSHFVARRINKLYGRSSDVIPPPVEVSPTFRPAPKGNYFFTASRLVPYKNVRAIVEAFRNLPDVNLLVAGDGPERASLQGIATSNVSFVGFVSDAELKRLMAEAQAFLFAAIEDFGIVLLEAQGMGTPVLALGRGGARETIITDGPAPTGMFFDQANPRSIAATVRRFLAQERRFDPVACHANALCFSEARFDRDFKQFVLRKQAGLWANRRARYRGAEAAAQTSFDSDDKYIYADVAVE